MVRKSYSRPAVNQASRLGHVSGKLHTYESGNHDDNYHNNHNGDLRLRSFTLKNTKLLRRTHSLFGDNINHYEMAESAI